MRFLVGFLLDCVLYSIARCKIVLQYDQGRAKPFFAKVCGKHHSPPFVLPSTHTRRA